MAIIREFYKTRTDGVNLFRTYSDEGFYILQNPTGIEYGEAIDVESAPYTYEETDKLIEVEEEVTEEGYEIVSQPSNPKQ